MTFTISPGTSDDSRHIVASSAALFASDAGRHDPAATNLDWPQQEGAAYYNALMASPDDLVLLARDGHNVAGHLVGRLTGPSSVRPIRVAVLESVHVYADYRGRGAGGQLVAAFMGWAADKGAQRAVVTAYAANEGAQRFYVRHGFAPQSVTLCLDGLPPARIS